MDMPARMQRIEQAVLGVGTDNGLYREVKAISARLESIDQKLDAESAERKAEWSQFYSRLAIWFVGAAGTVGVAFLIDRAVS